MALRRLHKEVHMKVEEAIFHLFRLKGIAEELVRETVMIGVPDIVGEVIEPVEINGIKAEKYLVIEIKTGERLKRDERIKQVSKYLAAVYIYGVSTGRIVPGEESHNDVVAIILRTSGRGIKERVDTKVGPIYLVTPDEAEAFSPLLPLVKDPTEEDVEKAISYVKKLVEEERRKRGRLKAESPLFKALEALKEAVMRLVLLAESKEERKRVSILIKYLNFLRSMTNVLAMADEKYPIRASVLAEIDEPVSREELLKAIYERRVVILDVKDLIALYARGLLRKEDIVEIIRNKLYVPQSIDELIELYRVGALEREDILRLLKEGPLPISVIKDLRRLVDENVISEAEYKALLEFFRSLF